MSLTHLHSIFINNSSSTSSRLALSPTNSLKSPKFAASSNPHFTSHLLFTATHQSRRFFAATTARAAASYGEGSSEQQVNASGFNFDAFLSVVEFLCHASSVAVAVYVAVSVSRGGLGVLGLLGSRIVAWQCVALVTGVVVGAVIRGRQWRRICGARVSRNSDSSLYVPHLLERVERLEEGLRTSAGIVRAMSRQLEKLGIRFRVTRKALKEPMAQAAALAQKNSEATRLLAEQEEILEKELGEIQNVLLAMQEQQQKQLELILAIAKGGKLWETKSVKARDENPSKTSKPSPDGVTRSKTIKASPDGVARPKTVKASPDGVASSKTVKASPDGVASSKTVKASPDGVASSKTGKASPDGVASSKTIKASPDGLASSKVNHSETPKLQKESNNDKP